jgi:hypothetical protein
MDLYPQEAGGPFGAALWKTAHIPHLDEAELAEILAAGNILPAVEHTLRRLFELEMAEEDDLFL